MKVSLRDENIYGFGIRQPSLGGRGTTEWWMREVLFHKAKRDNIPFYVVGICGIAQRVEDGRALQLTYIFMVSVSVSLPPREGERRENAVSKLGHKSHEGVRRSFKCDYGRKTAG